VVSNHIRRWGRYKPINSTMPYRTASIYKCAHNNARLKSIAADNFRGYAATTMGRPRQKPENYRGKYVRIRVTDAERAEILRRSKKAKAKNESVWIRQRLLGDD